MEHNLCNLILLTQLRFLSKTDQSAQTGCFPGASEQTPQCLSSLSHAQEPDGSLAAAEAVLPAG